MPPPSGALLGRPDPFGSCLLENPFLDYRFDILFSTTTDDGLLGESVPSPRLAVRRVTVPGYFAADGNASESSAVSGNVWRCVFRPPTVGLWTATVTFAETQPAKDARNARFGPFWSVCVGYRLVGVADIGPGSRPTPLYATRSFQRA